MAITAMFFFLAPAFGQSWVDERIAEVMGDPSYSDVGYDVCDDNGCRELEESRRRPLSKQTKLHRLVGAAALGAGLGLAVGGGRGAAAGSIIGGGAGLLGNTFGRRGGRYRLRYNNGGGRMVRTGYPQRTTEEETVQSSPRPSFSGGYSEYRVPDELRGRMDLVNGTNFFVTVMFNGERVGKMRPGQRWRVIEPEPEESWSAEASVPNIHGSVGLIEARVEPMGSGWEFFLPELDNEGETR